MNLAFNGVMWGLFTRALTLASSTVRVSVINTSANFVLTAILGAVIFREQLPGKYGMESGERATAHDVSGLWWLGAAMLVAGSVIIGRREEGKDAGSTGTVGNEPTGGAQAGFQDGAEVPLTRAEGVSSDSDIGHGESIELRRKTRSTAP